MQIRLKRYESVKISKIMLFIHLSNMKSEKNSYLGFK